jgi:hypothetical protein
MLVKMSCSYSEIKQYLEYAESEGLTLLEKQSLDKENVMLIFTSSETEVVTNFANMGAETFLEFQDGSVSPLYVRRDRDFSE